MPSPYSRIASAAESRGLVYPRPEVKRQHGSQEEGVDCMSKLEIECKQEENEKSYYVKADHNKEGGGGRI